MTVNKKKRMGRPTLKQAKLSKESIVTSARALLVANGKVPSIRMVAKDLDTDAMALYHYFPCKADLLESVSVSLVKDIYEPSVSDDWQGELFKLCSSYLLLLKNHAGLLESMLSISVEGPAQVFSDRLDIVLSPLGLDETVMSNALGLLADYLHGFALAMSCDSKGALSVEMIEGPLQLYTRALKAH